MRMDVVVVVVVVHLRRSVGKWSNHRGMLGVVPLCVYYTRFTNTVYEKKEKEEEEEDEPEEKQEDV